MTAVIILTYNGEQYLRRCIESVLRTDERPERWCLIVVDNDSRDETREIIASFGDRIEVVLNNANLGYAGGNNAGIRFALERGAEYVVLLNQDIEVAPDWLHQLIMAAESDPKIGAVQPRIMLGNGTDGHGSSADDYGCTDDHLLINSIGNEIHVLGFGFCGGHGERWTEVRSRLRGFPYPEVTYPSGAAVMYRATALRDIAFPRGEHSNASNTDSNTSNTPAHSEHSDGIRSIRMFNHLQFLDEDYFLYHEDLDIGVRLWLRGWRCVLAPQAVVTHHYEFSRSAAKVYWMERNRLLFLLENLRWPTLALLAPALLASEVGLLFFARRAGWLSEKLRVWRALLAPAHWRTFWHHRRAKQSLRRVGDRAVILRFTPCLCNQEVRSWFVERIMDPVVNVWWHFVRPLIRW